MGLHEISRSVYIEKTFKSKILVLGYSSIGGCKYKEESRKQTGKEKPIRGNP